jgi:hypothetical protein
MNFLPEGAEHLRTEKPYWKMSQMVEGDNKIRIVMRPIAGWIDWVDSKPVRSRPDERPSKSFDEEKPMKPFWAMYVWDYARKSLYLLEVTQAGIIKALTSFAKDEDWGDFTKYDIKIKKEGTGKETRYSVTPLPHKDLSPEIVQALKNSPVHLENLYAGGDPWNVSAEAVAAAPVSKTPLIAHEDQGEDFETLKSKVKESGITLDYLNEYVKGLAEKKSGTFKSVVNAALMPQFQSKFITAYASEVARVTAPA